MELIVHDLLQIRSEHDLIYNTPKPDWVAESIKRAPFVVVRRVHAENGLIPVGIRGKNRNERFAAFVRINNIVNIITPKQIVLAREWIHHDKEIFTYLEEIKKQMDEKVIDWGPGGSVGFELVSKVPTVNDKSDIDIIIRYTPELTLAYSRKLISELSKLPIHIDVQVETSKGSFSLHEFANSEGKPILFKTKNGPMLMHVSESY